MKTLKFAPSLVPLVLSKEKDTTWRINDDKDLSVNDQLSCLQIDGTEFAKAKILWVKMTTFRQLSTEDKSGHEPFSNDEEMYQTYQKYYNQEVTPETILKVVKFQLI